MQRGTPTTTTQLSRPTRDRIERLKLHRRQPIEEIVVEALDALERERREAAAQEGRRVS